MKSNKQIIIACDKQGKFIKYIPKEIGHTGKGLMHLAITVLLFNKKGEALLQKRKHKIFDDIWDLTGATHPLHLDDEDESFEEATLRCLKREYDINPEEVERLKNLDTFNYFAEYQNSLCENEHCAFLIGEFNGKLKLNSKVGYRYKWIDKKEFLKDIKINPKKYSPWAKEAIKLLVGF